MNVNSDNLLLQPALAWGAPEDLTLKLASSAGTREIMSKLVGLRNVPGPSVVASAMRGPTSVEEQLYDALAAVKIFTSRVAMHMDKTWRDKLFRQLDSLLDVDEWVDGDTPLGQASFATFLKVLFLFRPGRRPGLGLSSSGNLIGSWSDGDCQLTIECLPNDVARYVISRRVLGKVERSAGETSVSRLPAVLAPFEVSEWLARK